MMKEIFNKHERTEQVQDIIDKMPQRFGVLITGFVLALIIITTVFGWIVRYPDIVTGDIVINSNSSPIKLISNASGKLILKTFKSQANVMEGDYLAVIENSAKLEDVVLVQNISKKIDISNSYTMGQLKKFPRNLSLGELNQAYFSFLNAYEQFEIYQNQNLIDKQEELLRKTLIQQHEILATSLNKLEMSAENVMLITKFYKRDSILFSKKVLTEAELDKSRMNSISVKDAFNNTLNNITSLREQIQETTNKLQQTGIQKGEKKNQTRLELLSSYSELMANLKVWEQKYVFRSPVSGKIQFSKFWINDQFIQSGEPFAIIVPVQKKILGQMTLPAFGAGKVKVGQEVIIKLEDYPYTEYGSLKGKISTISIISNSVKTEKGDIATYMATVDLPGQLTTNYGSKLDFKFEIKGTGEIITRDRKLVERLFDNLKYAYNK